MYFGYESYIQKLIFLFLVPDCDCLSIDSYLIIFTYLFLAKLNKVSGSLRDMRRE